MSVIFPNRCPGCQTIKVDRGLCDNCSGLVRELMGESCKKCGCPIEYCECKKKGSVREYDGVIAACIYEGIIRHAVHNLKFYLSENAGRYLSDKMIERFKEVGKPDDYDLVTSVPDFSVKRRQKGRTHTEYLAARLAKYTGIRYKRVLKKVIDNPKQHRLSKNFRSGNVSGVYEADEKSVNGKRILLVDDVITTGMTANECAKMLKIRGAKSVTVFALAVKLPEKYTVFEPVE